MSKYPILNGEGSKLPKSFEAAGFVAPSAVRKRRRLLIGTDGPSDSGKSEFILSCPGPGMIICLDRGIDKVIDNPNPPECRGNFGIKTIKVPATTDSNDTSFFQNYWKDFKDAYNAACANDDCITLGIDGDSDSWELQRLAAFGKLTQVPPLKYVEVNAARRAMYAKAHDSCKIVIATNKIKRVHEEVILPNGAVKMGSDGTPVKEWQGKYDREGFSQQDYLFAIQLRHMYQLPRENAITKRMMPGQFGIKIMKCGPNSELINEELWGDQCNFRSLVEMVYPQHPPTYWGYKD